MTAIIDREHARWMVQGAASILLSSRSPSLRPSMGQGLGCRVSSDLTTVTVLVLEGQNAALVADLRHSGVVAVVFTNSRSTRSLQLKGRDAREAPLESGDGERMTAHVGALAREWSQTGQPEAFARALMGRASGDTVLAFRFSPYVAFDQTPGPRAGLPLFTDS